MLISGLAATRFGIAGLVHSQQALAAPAMSRNLSSFIRHDWQDHFPSLRNVAILSDTTRKIRPAGRAAHFISGSSDDGLAATSATFSEMNVPLQSPPFRPGYAGFHHSASAVRIAGCTSSIIVARCDFRRLSTIADELLQSLEILLKIVGRHLR